MWDVTVFTKNRERLIDGAVSQQLLEAVLVEAREHELLSEEHFTVDGTLIQAWAAARSFKEKSDPPAPGAGSGHKGEVLLRDKVESKTDPDARLYKKATADKSVPSLSGARVDGEPQRAGGGGRGQPGGHGGRARGGAEDAGPHGGAEGEAQPGSRRSRWAPTRSIRKRSLCRDCGIAKWRRMCSEYVKGNLGKNSLTDERAADERRPISQRKRKLIERVFGWSKLDRPLRQVKLRGLKRVDWFYRLTIAAYNLVRMRRLIPIQALAS